MKIDYTILDADPVAGVVLVEYVTEGLAPVRFDFHVPMVDGAPITGAALHDAILACAPVEFFTRLAGIGEQSKAAVTALVGLKGSGDVSIKPPGPAAPITLQEATVL